MARELSQAELLDFLCQAGGRVANATLLGHFRRFLRDPEATPAELQRRRELFKGFVNSVATVRQEGPDAAKYVVLRKRYRELVGEEPKPPAAAAAAAASSSRAAEPAPPRPPLAVGPGPGAPQGQAGPERAAKAHGGACRREPPRRQVEEERPGRAAARQPRACPELRGGRPGEAGGRSEAPWLPGPPPGLRGRPPAPRALVEGERRRQTELGKGGPEAPLCLRGGAPEPPGPGWPVGEMGAPPSEDSARQRIRDWVATHCSPAAGQREECASWAARPSPPGWARSTCPTPAASLDPAFEPPRAGVLRDHVPVFRSIRCQLSLQDLEDFIEQESSASEDGSSASGGSDSYRLEGDAGLLLPRFPGRQNVHSRMGDARTTAPEGPHPKPPANGPVGMPLPPRGSAAQQNGPVPGHLTILSQIAGRADKPWSKEAERQSGDQPKVKKITRLPPLNLDAPLNAQPVSRQGHAASRLDSEGLVLDADGSTEHRSSLVPLEPREHAWLVKVATGSWMQAQALLLEDPHLATRKDFISGFTVLHWLAKHGNAQVLQDVVTGARKAGVPLDVNIKSGCGYTPLHLAAMHGHSLVIQVLVQKLRCRVQVRDSSGKRPWQYLSSATSGEVWQLLGAPRGQTIFPAHPITRSANSSPARKGESPKLARKISRTASLAAYLKPQHLKWKMGNKWPPLHEREDYSD